MPFDMSRFAVPGKAILRFALGTGLLNPIVESLSESSRLALDRLDGLVKRALLIYQHKQAIGQSKESSFAEFLSSYLSSVGADALDSRQVDAERVMGSVVRVLMGVVAASPRYWNDAIKNVDGFVKTDLGGDFADLGSMAVNEFRPIMDAILQRVAVDYAAAKEWKDTSNN